MRITNMVTPSLPSADPRSGRSRCGGRKWNVLAVVAVMLLSYASHSNASPTGFTGATVSADYDWPTLGTALYPSGTAVVGPGVEFDNIGGFGVGNSPSVDFSDANILVTYPGGWSLSGVGTFDGWVFSVLNNGPTISGVSLAGSNIPGLTGADLSFDATDVYVNTLGLGGWNPGSFISIDATFASVPDGGSTAALLGVALTGIAGLRRKVGVAKA